MVNMLKLNDDKMESIIFGTRQQLAKLGKVSNNIGSIQVQLVDHVRNLGYHMDQLLNNGPHINKLVSNLNLKLNNNNMQRICSQLDQKSSKTMVQAIIQSRLDS